MSNSYLSLIKAVWTYGKQWRWLIIAYYFALMVAQACMSLSPYAFGRAIDVLQSFNPEKLNLLVYWLGIGVLVILLFWLFHGPARLAERTIALKIQQQFRLTLYEQLSHLPLKWHQENHSGNIMTRINRASLALHRFADSQFIYIQAVVKFFISIGFLTWISLPIGIISLVTSFIIAGIVILFDRKLIPLYDAQNEIDNHIGAVLFDYISNMTTVLTLRLGELTHANLYQRFQAVWPFFRKEAFLNEFKWFVMMMLLSVVQAFTLITYIIYSLNTSQEVMIGAVVMIFRYQWDLSQVFHELSLHYSELVHMDTDVRGLRTIQEDIKQYAHLPQGAKTAQLWHRLHISNLTFQHAEKSERAQIFKHIALDIKRGEKIALIGKSGGGKSTLLNILSGLYQPSQVSLRIDDKSSFDSLEPLQAITTLIPQDPEIFENTIAFNITMDLPTKSEEIMQAVELAGFSQVLKALPSGLLTDIREKGLNLSLGQKQRLALARGIFAARFSSLILLDEPTSSVDLPTEYEILSGLIKAFPESAMIVSLHRLHLLAKFDRIIMLDHGDIVASGATEALLKSPGPVQDLWLAYQHNKIDHA